MQGIEKFITDQSQDRPDTKHSTRIISSSSSYMFFFDILTEILLMDAYHFLPTYKYSLRNSRVTRNPVSPFV